MKESQTFEEVQAESERNARTVRKWEWLGWVVFATIAYGFYTFFHNAL